jgi:hypothetical protein
VRTWGIVIGTFVAVTIHVGCGATEPAENGVAAGAPATDSVNSSSPDSTALEACGAGADARSGTLNILTAAPGPNDGQATVEDVARRFFAVFFDDAPLVPDFIQESSEAAAVGLSYVRTGLTVSLRIDDKTLASVTAVPTEWGRFIYSGHSICHSEIEDSGAIRQSNVRGLLEVGDDPSAVEGQCQELLRRLASVDPAADSIDCQKVASR